MEELIMKAAPRAYNRKKMFQARVKADKVKNFVTVNPEDKYFYTKEGSFMDWRYCKKAPRERTSKRESLELKRYRDVCTKSVSKHVRRVYDHMFREALRDHEVMEYMDRIRAYGVAEDEFVDEMLMNISEFEEENNFTRLSNGVCVYEPPIKDILEAFDDTLNFYIRDYMKYMQFDGSLYDDEEFLFKMELIRAQIETGSLSYSDIIHSEVLPFGKYRHEDAVIWCLRNKLTINNFLR